MTEQICRTLRDGTLKGELAVALTIEDSLRSPFGLHAFDHFFLNLAANISAGKSQACGVVLVALDRSPSWYLDLLKGKGGLHVGSSPKWLSILDCYSDPLGWKMKLRSLQSGPEEAPAMGKVADFRDVRDVDKLLWVVLDLGRGFVGEGKARFSVAIDSVSTLLRHASISSVAKLISSIRSSEKISSIIWLMHSDLHEPRHSAALKYISTAVASLEPKMEYSDGETSSENLFCLEQNLVGGRFVVRMKRRNGRVKILNEEFHVEQDCIRFSAAASENTTAVQNLTPKVQFNLQLSEKERADRARVVLPFEHQGKGEDIKIYDGRRSLLEGKRGSQLDRLPDQGKGEIHYVRDSDDELLDSDEDPDDDLDI